jgi:hypothetical protein
MFGSFLPSLRSSINHSLLGSRSRHCYAITFKETSKRIGSAMTLKAEAGRVYYLRTQVYERSEQDHNVKLEPVETAEGQFLISASAFSTSHPKK